MNEPSESDQAYEILEKHVNQLSEHFDNVQILVSSVTDGGDYTTSYTRGAGNMHARVNQARLLVMRFDEAERHGVRLDVENVGEEPDGGEQE